MAITFFENSKQNKPANTVHYINFKNVNRTLVRVESLVRVAEAEVATGGVDFGGCLEARAPRWIP